MTRRDLYLRSGPSLVKLVVYKRKSDKSGVGSTGALTE